MSGSAREDIRVRDVHRLGNHPRQRAALERPRALPALYLGGCAPVDLASSLHIRERIALRHRGPGIAKATPPR